ncbi:hypothetical protein ALP66_05460, partial [Pseudomonas amygdali pv. photiniae]
MAGVTVLGKLQGACMTSFSTAAQDAKARAEQSSTRIAFFIAGFSVASWAPLVPYVKQ